MVYSNVCVGNNTHTSLRKQQFSQKSNGSARCMLLQLLKVDKSQKKTLKATILIIPKVNKYLSLIMSKLPPYGVAELHVPKVRYNMSCTGTLEKVSSLVV